MRNRIVSIVLALSLLATVFVAFSTTAAIDYEGSVKTTDMADAPKDVYVEGQEIYVACEVFYQGYHAAVDIEVRLEYLDGDLEDNFHATADFPDDGWYNGTDPGGQTLWTGGVNFAHDDPWGQPQDRVVMYVVLEEDWSGFEIARTTVTILMEGLTLEPPTGMGGYTPGQALTVKLITHYTGDILYVHTTNASVWDGGSDVAGMNWTTVIAPQGYWEKSFTLSPDMPDGTYTMKVRDTTTHALRHYIEFNVQKYFFNVMADRYLYLPTQVAKMEIIVVDIATFAPVPGVVVNYWAQWNNFSANGSTVFHTWQNGTVPTSMGTWEFPIPADVVLYDDIEIMLWANESTTRSLQTWVDLSIGQLRGSVDAADDSYYPGETVVVETYAFLYGWSDWFWDWIDDPLSGCTVDVTVLYNGTAVADYGKAGMTTADDGTVTYTFPLAADAGKGVYTVKAVVSTMGHSVTVMDSFIVDWSYWIDTNFDKDYYYIGDTATVTFEAMWNGAPVETASINYAVETNDEVLVTGSTSEGMLEVDLPDGYFGGVWIWTSTIYNGYSLSGMDWAEVRMADLSLSAERDEYWPGETLVFNWNIVTNLEDANLEWELVDWDGVKVDGDSPDFDTSGSFEFEVPDEDPPGWYTATIWMTTDDGGFEEASVDVDLVGDDELRVWPGKSKYVTGEFRPGDDVSLKYSISAIWHDAYPSYELYIWTDFDPAGTSMFVDSNEGSVSFYLPEDTPAGQMAVYVEVYDAATGAWLDDAETTIVVNQQLSGWDRSVAGMAASDFTILILIVIMILLLIIVPLLKSKGVMSKSEKTEAPPPTPPQ